MRDDCPGMLFYWLRAGGVLDGCVEICMVGDEKDWLHLL